MNFCQNTSFWTAKGFSIIFAKMRAYFRQARNTIREKAQDNKIRRRWVARHTYLREHLAVNASVSEIRVSRHVQCISGFPALIVRISEASNSDPLISQICEPWSQYSGIIFTIPNSGIHPGGSATLYYWHGASFRIKKRARLLCGVLCTRQSTKQPQGRRSRHLTAGKLLAAAQRKAKHNECQE